MSGGPPHHSHGRQAPPSNTAWNRLQMDEEMDVTRVDDKLKRKRELSNARVKKYRQKKRTKSQQLNSSMQDDPTKEMQNKQVEENNAERKRAMAKERSRKYRAKKRLNVLKSDYHVVRDSQFHRPSHEIPPLVLRNQRTTIHDSQIAGTSTNFNIPFVRTTIHDSQIAGTSTNMSIPRVVRDDSKNLNRIGENLLSPPKEENPALHVDDNLLPSEDQVCVTLNVHYNRSSTTYSTYARHRADTCSVLPIVKIFRAQVPNYYPRQPQLAHMSNEHPLLHQPTWHTPTTEPMKTIPHPHMFNLEQMLSERSYPRSGVDLTLTRNGSQNGDLPTTPISLSVRDTNKINSLPASALEIQAVELKTPVMKSLSPGLKSTSPGIKPLSPAISTSPGLIERQGSPKSTKKPKRMDSILERLNSQPMQSETAEKPASELPTEKSVEKAMQPVQSVIVQPSNSIHDENSNSSSILNVPTPTNLREDEVTSPYSNDDSLDSNKSRRKRKPSKTIRLTKESEKVPELNEDPLKLDPVVKDGGPANIETEPTVATEAAKTSEEGAEPQRERSDSRSSDSSAIPAAKKTRRKTSSESETIAKIAAMVQEVVNENTMESQKEETPSKPVSVSVIRDITQEIQTSNSAGSESNGKNDKVEEETVVAAQELPSTSIITPAQRKATNFVEVENKLEEMFAGIEESSTTPKVDPLEIDCEKMDDFITDSKDETDAKFDGPSTSQNNISTSNDVLTADKSSPKKARVARRKLNNSYEKKKKAKKGKEFAKAKVAKKGKKSVNGKQIKVNAIKDIYAYDSGSNTSSVKSKGPFIQIKGPRDSPISVSIVNTPVEDESDKKSGKNKKFHDDSEYRHKVRSKGLHCSTLSNKYDAQTKDVSWICVFCKRGPHSTDPNVLGPSTFSAQVLPPGDLFGPYVITSNCPEYERRMDDPYDKQFKSKKIARVLDASTSSNVQMKVSGKKSKRKHSESDRSFNELDVTDTNLGITETGDKTFEIWVHEDCVVWSPGVYLVGPKIVGLEEAVWTSCNVACTRCGYKGANICCLRRGCTNVMHFGCASASNWQLAFDNYTALCIAHKTV